jgi:hypothetical protein
MSPLPLCAVTLLLLGITACAPQPPSGPEAQARQDDARWADLEAQRRITDGDYDGAVQAYQQAQQDLRAANRDR